MESQARNQPVDFLGRYVPLRLLEEFATYMSYIREMDGQEKPNYKDLRQLFNRVFSLQRFRA